MAEKVQPKSKTKREVITQEDIQKLRQMIVYSDKYSDDQYEYRHVILPKPLFKLIPKSLYNPDGSGTLRLLSEVEWRHLGVLQSPGWEHYEVHAPEPHVLLFRRPLDYAPISQPAQEQPARRVRHYAPSYVSH